MVVAHNDLVHTASRGMRTALVSRPTEYRPHQSRDFEPEHDFDIVAADFVDLAAKSGAA